MSTASLVKFKSDYGDFLSNMKLIRFNKNQFVVSKGGKVSVLIGEFDAEIINFFLKGLSLDEGLQRLVNQYEISLNDGIEVVSKCLEKIKIEFEKEPYKYMTWSIELIKFKNFSKWWNIPSTLFKPKPFFTWLIASILVSGLMLYFWKEELLLSLDIPLVTVFKDKPYIIAYFFLINLASNFLHEIGHLLASGPKGNREISIHFGFYLVFPVFYCDLSHVWTQSKLQRVIINLGGVAVGFVISTTWLIYCYLIDQPMYAILSVMGIYSIFIQLIPFGRSDGYWLLSDIFDEPNLQYRFVEWLKGDMERGSISNFVKYYGYINFGLMTSLVVISTVMLFGNFISTFKKIYETLIITQQWEGLTFEDLYLVLFGLGNILIVGVFSKSLYKFGKKKFIGSF